MATKEPKFIDKKSIKELADILDELELTELSYQKGDVSISVSKGTTLSTVSTKATSIEDSKVVSDKDYRDDPRVIKSPMVGTVYLQPEPGANKFINEGDSISLGQTMLIIEAMKTMNPIESNLQGKISKIFVQNEEAVEFGQPLVLVE
ncbi:acetyl-CoA carboxylase biotin carboxyl carrier protein subunit [Pelagibacterales bacterium]|jgi:acetyl-CoA carboxylase biotin carboxyl carrier protein|nr:acetyl-CoA carboxylase biotin carboxyl carrier protein subunit [Pelagibacterales bacterium]